MAIHRMITADAFIMSRSSLSMSMALIGNQSTVILSRLLCREPRCRIGYGHPANSHRSPEVSAEMAGMWAGWILWIMSLQDNVAEGLCHVMSCFVT